MRNDDRSRSRRFFLLTTPGAGNGAAWSRLKRLMDRSALSARARVALVGSLDEMTAALETLEKEEIPVAAGGDGTANLLAAALNQCHDSPRLCATLPLGTGNAFAHSLGAGDLPTAMATLQWGEPRPVDLMELDHPRARIALVSISTGFESRFIHAFSRSRMGPRVMATARGLAAAIEPPSAEAALTLDGVPFVAPPERSYNVGLYNLPCYAFGARVHPESQPDDGHAEAVWHSTAVSYWRAIRRGWRDRASARRGPWLAPPATPAASNHRERFARWTSATLESAATIQVDGESLAGGSFEIRVKRAPLEWLTPPERPDRAAT